MTNTFIRSSIAKGTTITTERGTIAAENIRVNDTILTEQKSFVLVQAIEKVTAPHHYKLQLYGLDPIELEPDAQLMVRDIEILPNNGGVEPRISWPYWIAIKDLDMKKHVVLSPFNPHALNPYGITSYKNNPSGYRDYQEQLWLQIAECTYSSEPIEAVRVHLVDDTGMSCGHIAVK